MKSIVRPSSNRVGNQFGRRLTVLRGDRHQEGIGWRAVAIAATVLVLALGALVTLIIVLVRSGNESERPATVSSLPPGSTHPTQPNPSGLLPAPRLVDENESVRALLAQIHGRGKESTQLRALLDEEAGLAQRALSSEQCQASPEACNVWVKLSQIKGIPRRQAGGSPDQLKTRWMVGLRLPSIPVENDPSVQRQFELYTESPVLREQFEQMLFRCGAYRDLIQSSLVRHDLPLDLLALVFAESSCSPTVRSQLGAAGLWQLLPGTARAYGLLVKEGVVDERLSPAKSTEAAIKFLLDLRDKFMVYNRSGVWELVLAAYNLGPFRVLAYLERAGAEVSFWDLRDAGLLPEETAEYVPRIQAFALILNNLQRLKFTGVQMRTPELTSDLEVLPGTRLSLVARAASTSINHLRELNPDITGDRTPDVPHFAVQVPREVVWRARDALKDYLARGDDLDQCVPPSFDWGRQQFTKELADACRRRLRAGATP